LGLDGETAEKYPVSPEGSTQSARIAPETRPMSRKLTGISGDLAVSTEPVGERGRRA
jgi:hypothetical protein